MTFSSAQCESKNFYPLTFSGDNSCGTGQLTNELQHISGTCRLRSRSWAITPVKVCLSHGMTSASSWWRCSLQAVA